MNKTTLYASAAVWMFCQISVPASAAPVTGAIFTTTATGSVVNANHFDSKCSVYLDGGPGPNAPAKAAGLPNGEYYFQVTDPSGKVLLSTDPVSNRRFRVSGGVIVAYAGVGGPVHPTGVDMDHSALGAITIRLANATCPDDFLDSPNGGGTYKVWATPVSDYMGDPANVSNACGNGCFHGFVASKSKTDNFKAKTGTPTFCLTVQKELQQPDGTFGPKSGWQINVTDPLNVTNPLHTDDAGQAKMCGLTEGNYTVAEVLQTGTIVYALIVNGTTMPIPDTTYSFSWTPSKPAPVVLFRNGTEEVPN
jgi:hypothetical protein